ncbi:hypothetical protein GSI_07696 [Ganoderma sinense ZZ0214-1]|uniref:Uncharacterized protein n=1 Tax=Ganoderma sinense ZZ0214-1 TaxID=1077348 RepID=A0A2G8S8L7_9APHY|nr:hypothetical protein GSI_07696 [Ganoderma sinense ZZ0214-1]
MAVQYCILWCGARVYSGGFWCLIKRPFGPRLSDSIDIMMASSLKVGNHGLQTRLNHETNRTELENPIRRPSKRYTRQRTSAEQRSKTLHIPPLRRLRAKPSRAYRSPFTFHPPSWTALAATPASPDGRLQAARTSPDSAPASRRRLGLRSEGFP